MSLLLLIDGYNVVAPTAAPSRHEGKWLQLERMQLLSRLAKHLPQSVRSRCCIVFDAANPPPDRPNRFSVEEIDVRFATEYREADDLIEEIIQSHHSAKQLAVVSSDQRIQRAAKRRGAKSFESQDWLDELLDGKLHLASRPKTSPPALTENRGASNGTSKQSDQDQSNLGEASLSPDKVEEWMKEFGFDE